jgi:hypothetical protein
MKKETLEEAAERVAKLKYGDTIYGLERVNAFKEGAKWQAERMYSRQYLIDFVYFINGKHFNKYTVDTDEVDLFIEQFKKK